MDNNPQEIAMSVSEHILSDYLTQAEAAVELPRNPRTLERWHLLGIGPPRVRIGRQIFYRRSSLLKWLEAREQV